MKSYATFFVIAVMALGLFTLVVTKSGTKHDAPAEVIDPTEQADAAAEAGAVEAGVANASASVAPPAAPPGQTLRITSLGWDLVAAGAALAGADGKTAPAMELAPESQLDALEARLARGGGDPQGADVAVLPLPAFVVSYERLRALEPRAFLVVGFSRGREEVRGAFLKPPAAGDEVKIVAFAPATATEGNARTWGSESATVAGVFALDLLGVAPSRLKFLAPGTDGKAAPYAALVRGAPDERRLAFSTADASRLVPIVAVAPKSVVEARTKELTAFGTAWLDGLGRAGKDAPAVARRLAAKENLPLAAGVGGAPEAVHLVERLGQLEAATPATQHSMFVGTTPVTLTTLAQRTWTLARGSGLTSVAAPDPLPLDPRVAKAIAPPPVTPAKPGGEPGALPANATPLALYRETGAAADAASVASQLGFLGGVFERAVFRVTAKGGDKAARAIADAAIEKHGLAANRVGTAAAEPQGAFAAIEILSPP
jgi:hypothetical protein